MDVLYHTLDILSTSKWMVVGWTWESPARAGRRFKGGDTPGPAAGKPHLLQCIQQHLGLFRRDLPLF